MTFGFPGRALILLPLLVACPACSGASSQGQDSGFEVADPGADPGAVADTPDEASSADVPEVPDDVPDGPADALPDAPGDTLPDAPPDAGPDVPAYHWRDPWPVPQGPWSGCPEVPSAAGALAAKAAMYDWLAPRLHMASGTADDGRTFDWAILHDVRIDGTLPAAIGDPLPRVVSYEEFGNSGLYTSLYTASQAFRYAATKDPEALANLRRAFGAERALLRITGTPGYFARGMWQPMPGFNAPVADGHGSVKVETGEFAGFTWVGDTSKDEYAGHAFSAGIIAKIVDDATLQAQARDVLVAIGHHLVDHAYWITDQDGAPTSYGSVNAMSMDEIPGFNAVLALGWTRLGALAGDDPVLASAYFDCLLQRSPDAPVPCIDQPYEDPRPYTDWMSEVGLLLGCQNSYDNINMALLAFFNLPWFEEDPGLRAFYRHSLVANTRGPDLDGYDLWAESDPHFNYMFAAMADPDDPAARPAADLCARRPARSSASRPTRSGTARPR